MDSLTEQNEITPTGAPLVLVAVKDEALWLELSAPLEKHFRVRRETDGLRAMDVLTLLRPIAVIAESGLPGLSGILLARLIGHNRFLTCLPVALILSRQYLIEEFWARESGALVVVQRNDARTAVDAILGATKHMKPIPDNDWDQAETNIIAQGGPAAGVASELEGQLIGASILARLGEIEIGVKPGGTQQEGTIPTFIGKALSALSSVLEFALVAVSIFDTCDLFIVENETFKDVLDRDWFVRETINSCELYITPDKSIKEPSVNILPPVQHELPGPREPASTYFALPLSGRSGIYGLLSIMTFKQIAIREYYLHTLSLIGTQLAVTLERALFYEEVRRLSVTDPLTGLSNRRAIFARLEEEFRRSTRYGSPMSVAVADLDNFKQINDHHGHYAGDAILRDVANILRKSVREVDLAGRWGGEEMALLFPQTTLEGAIIACERVRREVERNITKFHGLELQVTLSIGIATLEPDKICPRSAESLVNLADNAMYLAKTRGKNQVATYKELEDQPYGSEPKIVAEFKPVDFGI